MKLPLKRIVPFLPIRSEIRSADLYAIYDYRDVTSLALRPRWNLVKTGANH
jgi:hypothetical protein